MKNTKNLSTKNVIGSEFKRFCAGIICFISIIFIMSLPQTFAAQDNFDFNSNLKNYNVKLQIFNQDKKLVKEFLVAIADTPKKQTFGLMNIEKLPSNYGMLFTFEDKRILSMWMKNTKISLDMLFIDENNKIRQIIRKTEPYSLKIISSDQEVIKVLEINGGLSDKLGIAVGNEIKIENQ